MAENPYHLLKKFLAPIALAGAVTTTPAAHAGSPRQAAPPINSDFLRTDAIPPHIEKSLVTKISNDIQPADFYFVADGNHKDGRIPQLFRDLIPTFKKQGVKTIYLENIRESQWAYDKIANGQLSEQQFLDLFPQNPSAAPEETTYRTHYRKTLYGIAKDAAQNGIKVLCTDDRSVSALYFQKNNEASAKLDAFIQQNVVNAPNNQAIMRKLTEVTTPQQAKEEMIKWLTTIEPEKAKQLAQLSADQARTYREQSIARLDDSGDTDFIVKTSAGHPAAILRGAGHANTSPHSMTNLLDKYGKVFVINLNPSPMVEEALNKSSLICENLGVADCYRKPNVNVYLDGAKVITKKPSPHP